MTDTTKICNAIKGLPEGSLLSASFDERYQVVGTTDDLKALVAENERFRQILGTAQKAAKLFADTLPPKGGQAIARDLLETINETLATHGGNDD